jgi:DNA-directed RNA polymerase III subunit RPC1
MEGTKVIQAPPVGKLQVVDRVPKVIEKLQFGILSAGPAHAVVLHLTICRSSQDVVNQSQVEISDRRLFDLDKGRAVNPNGPLDPRMGISGKRDECETCRQNLTTCNGHFGHVKLILPVFHVGYFKKTITMLQCICKVYGAPLAQFLVADMARTALASCSQS